MDKDELAEYDNINAAKASDYRDGDKASNVVYDYGNHSLINDSARVYKGGSWADRAYWLSPGARRFKNQFEADRNIGFRCAMHRVGGTASNDDTAGNTFKTKSRRKSRRY
jgi:formylglycine-generating enzyme required for sulfatase activity